MSLVLIGTLVAPVAAEEAPTHDDVLVPVLSEELDAALIAPVLTSEPAVVPEGFLPEGDFTDLVAVLDAPSLGKGVAQSPPRIGVLNGFDAKTSEVIDSDEFTTTYRNADGTKATTIGLTPLNVKSDGSWVPLSTEVSKVEQAWVADGHPLQPEFSESADDVGGFSVSHGEYRVSFTLHGANDSSLTRSVVPRTLVGLDQVAYPDVFDGVDLKYEVTASGVKETLVLAEGPEVGHTMWRWSIDAPGLTLAKNEWGDIEFFNASGARQFLIPAPVMWDSSAIAGVQEAVQSPVDAILSQTKSGWDVTLSADRAWLADKDRVYPVFVDPSVDGGWWENDVRSYKSDGASVTGYVNIGNSRDGGVDRWWRAVAHYGYEAVFGKQVLDAALTAIYDGAGTTDCHGGLVHHASAFSYYGTGAFLSNWTPGCPGGEAHDTALPRQLASWVSTGTPGAYLMLRGSESNGTYTYKTW